MNDLQKEAQPHPLSQALTQLEQYATEENAQRQEDLLELLEIENKDLQIRVTALNRERRLAEKAAHRGIMRSRRRITELTGEVQAVTALRRAETKQRKELRRELELALAELQVQDKARETGEHDG